MIPDKGSPGWTWFEPAIELPADSTELELCRAFARCFSSPEGQLVIDHLTKLIRDRRLSPGCSDGELRHLEGQRFAIAHIVAMIERGHG